MTIYVVFRKNAENVWELIGEGDADQPGEVVKAVAEASGDGTYSAVRKHVWKPQRVAVRTVTEVVLDPPLPESAPTEQTVVEPTPEPASA